MTIFLQNLLTSRRYLVLVICLFCQVFYMSNVLAEDDYSKGLQAYIQGDFSAAEEYWRKSARQKNARAMFNLGLLYQQGKIANADSNVAEQWFEKASDAGYTPADYHHAMSLLIRDQQSKKARQLLSRSAQKNYLPARSILAKINANQNIDTLVLSTGLSDRASSSVNANMYLSEPWLRARRGSDWTIQLLAFKEQRSVESFIDAHGLHDKAAYFSEPSETASGEVLYKLVYGAYSSKANAGAARDTLAPALKEHGPWLRTIASVQEIIKK